MRGLLESAKSFCWAKRLTRYKAIEVENRIDKLNSGSLFNFWVGLTTKGDHAGFRFSVGLLDLWDFDLNIYDSRHWNWEKDRWYDRGEEAVEYFFDTIEDRYEMEPTLYNEIMQMRPDELALISLKWYEETGLRISIQDAAVMWKTYSTHCAEDWKEVAPENVVSLVEYYDRIYYVKRSRNVAEPS